MNGYEKELERKALQPIPENASQEEMLRILHEKQAAMSEMQGRWKAEGHKFGTFMKWLDRANYVWLVILLIAFATGLVAKLREGGTAALNLWSGPFRTLGLFLLFLAYALRGKISRK